MGQVPLLVLSDDLLELRTLLKAGWPTRLAALVASRVPVSLYEELTDEQLNAKAAELGVQVAADADRDTILAALNAHKPPEPATPPWGDDFDPERAWSLIQKLRGSEKEAEQLRTQLKEHEDAKKTDQERAAERAAEAERAAAAATSDAARLRVALKKGLTETQAKRLIGDTEEALEADADELLASFHTDEDPAGPDPLRRTPRERLRPGAAPSGDPEETDPAKLAAMVPRRYA